MALGGNYATSDELKGYLGQATADTTDNTRITDALNSASRSIEKYCHRQFNAAAFQGPLVNSLGLESGNNYVKGCFQSVLDLSIAGWSFVFFLAMIVAAFALIRRN